MSWKVRLTEASAEAMTYAVRARIKQEQGHGADPAHHEEIERLIDALYPVVGEEVIYVPYTHLEELLDVMILALHTMPKRSIAAPLNLVNQRGRLNAQKLTLIKHLASDAVTRLSVVAP